MDNNSNDKAGLKFNIGIGTTERLNSHLNQIAHCRVNGMGSEWANLLFSIFIELSPKLNEKDVLDLKKQQNDIITELNHLNVMNTRRNQPKIKLNSGLYSKCWAFEWKLREKLDENDLLYPTGDEFEGL